MTKQPPPTDDEMLARTGVFNAMPYGEYERLSGLRKSCLWIFHRRTAAHYLHAVQNPVDEDRDCLRLGSATHTIVWEPDQFEARYMVSPPPPPIPMRPEVTKWNRTYKEHKAAWAQIVNEAAAAGKTILDNEEYDRCRSMRDKLHAHPQASRLIAAAKAEVSIQWIDAQTGLLLKGRLDGLVASAGLIIDLKTAATAEPFAFGRQALECGYHYQMAMYSDGLAALTAKTPAMPVLIVIESAAPFEVAAYELNEHWLALGRDQYRYDLAKIKEYQAADRWPGYPTGLMDIPMPDWAGKEIPVSAMEEA